MKFLRNPKFVIVLAVLALGLVVRNVFWPMISAMRPRKAAVRAAVLPTNASTMVKAVAAVKSVLVTDDPAPPPLLKMELEAAQVGAARWSQSPARDPFRSRLASESRTAQLLRLKGVWRQKDGDLAVINSRVLAEGDGILDYRVEKIETDQVWVSGPYGREALYFTLPVLANDSQPTKLALESERPLP